MIKKFTLFTFAIAMIGMGFDLSLNDAMSKMTGAPAGHTGSPGDGKNCTQCHTNLAPDTSAAIFATNMPGNIFYGDSTYEIKATVYHPGSQRFGFQASPQTAAGALQGELIVTDTARTQLMGSGKYITHTLNGTPASNLDASQWVFGWKAPNVPAPVTFYAAFNATNNNSQPTGDTIYVVNMTFQPHATVGMKEQNGDGSVSIYPNPTNGLLHYSIANGNFESNAEIMIYNMQGQLVATEKPGSAYGSIDLQSLASGIYFVKVRNGESVSTTRISKN